VRAVLLLCLGAGLIAASSAQAAWRELAPGFEFGRFAPPDRPGDSTIAIVRIDPQRWEVVLRCPQDGEEPAARTARAWAQEEGLAAATNAGMYATDFRTHIGYLQCGGLRPAPRRNAYQSLAVFEPVEEGLPPFRIHDLDAGADLAALSRGYRHLAQNLRLIKRPGENRWSEEGQAWSEAALGEDASGRLLFLFCRSAYPMRALNRILLDLPIGLVAAQHLEGGPQAQLFLDCGGVKIELSGAVEKDVRTEGIETGAWPVPNLIGVRPRAR